MYGLIQKYKEIRSMAETVKATFEDADGKKVEIRIMANEDGSGDIKLKCEPELKTNDDTPWYAHFAFEFVQKVLKAG
jgi:hypothetical protein